MVVARPRLETRLAEATQRRLTVVCAPAGSGKSFLLGAWARAADVPVAWLLLDELARAGTPFWTAVAAALRTVDGLEDVAPTHDGVADALSHHDEPLVLVVDDAHLLGEPNPLPALLALPGPLRMVVATRHDPELPLHLLRLVDELAEIRGDELAFTREETRTLLELGGLALADAQVEQLAARTEGWAAGLRLAALSLAEASDQDVERRVADFAGDDRTVADYLVHEVLARVDDATRDLLLRSSILDEVCGPLADALTGRQDGAATLAELDRSNAFLVGLDRRRVWYRQHQLLRDLLSLHRRWELPGLDADLHRRAADWHAREGDPVAGAHHAIAAGDWPRARAILGEQAAVVLARGRLEALSAALAAMPISELEAEPAVAAVALALAVADPDDEDRLRAAAAAAPVPAAVARVFRADTPEEIEAATAEAERVLPGGGSPATRALGLLALGTGRLWMGRAPDACAALGQGQELATAQGYTGLAAFGGGLRAVLGMTDGRLREAHDLAVAGLDASTARDGQLLAPAHLALGFVELERDDLDSARRHVEHARAVLEGSRYEPLLALLRMAEGGLRLARERPAEALVALEGPEPPVLLRWPIGLVRARAHLALGDAERARAVLAELPPSASVEVVEASLLRAAGDTAAALAIAEAVTDDARRPTDAPPATLRARVGASALAAMLHADAGRRDAAFAALERALDLAEPEGMRRPFVVLGPELPRLLLAHLAAGSAHRAFGEGILDGGPPGADGVAGPSDELSPRELAVLRYLPTSMTGTEIAAELFVSTNTVRTHIKHIYDKLGVHSRREAVLRARDLGLLAPGRLVAR